MESEPLTLLLAGKSTAEIELASSLLSNNSLKLSDHANLLLHLHSDDDTTDETPSFDVNSYFNSLSASRFGRFLLWSSRLPSTHDVVSQNFGELPIGAVCVADVQFKGRGRSTNVWESPRGCLMFSYTIEMEDGRIVPLVQYVASLAFTEAIKDICSKNGLPQLEVKIKWPNDLYLNGLKVGGILCTSTYRAKKFNISVGIGVNVDNRQPTTCLNERLQELTSNAFQLRREDILGSFFEKFETFFQKLITQGFHPMEELYYQTWLHSGQRVIIQDTCDGQTIDSVVTIQGLTSTGYLMALGDDGQMCELHPDGNSLDFFKGLVRHKLS
ncbi:biotin--protein ligase 1, chloroplastic-like [Silene latifolia]|uniref:biotin--protein ligase 1, chloroplastic-like n=1 Tax=Silene latifolia TaxID=37657 RepID=UPI003D774A31